MDEKHADPFEQDRYLLHSLRSHLGVALLAASGLCRIPDLPPPAQQFCTYLTDALAAMREDVAMLDARLTAREEQAPPTTPTVEKPDDTTHEVY